MTSLGRKSLAGPAGAFVALRTGIIRVVVLALALLVLAVVLAMVGAGSADATAPA